MTDASNENMADLFDKFDEKNLRRAAESSAQFKARVEFKNAWTVFVKTVLMPNLLAFREQVKRRGGITRPFGEPEGTSLGINLDSLRGTNPGVHTLMFTADFSDCLVRAEILVTAEKKWERDLPIEKMKESNVIAIFEEFLDYTLC